MTEHSDPDKTREIRRPSPPAGPAPEVPWWQDVNRHIPPPPQAHPPPRRPPPPTPAPHLRPGLRPPPPVRPPAARPVTPPRTPTAPQPQPAKRRASQRTLLIRAGIALLAIEAVILGVVLSRLQVSNATRVLDIGKAQRGVERILLDPVDGYGVKAVTGVVCNDGKNPVIRKGLSFSCDAVVDGMPRHVAVVFQNDEGTYAVDRPR